MISTLMMTEFPQLLAAGADGRWLGQDYVLALIAATFPAWALFTLVSGWVGGRAGVAVSAGGLPHVSESARGHRVDRR